METTILKTKRLANSKDVFFQLVQGDFNYGEYAIQYIKKLKTTDKLLCIDSYETKERTESVFQSLVRINEYNKKYPY
jgi:hypothetical protein